tara:strand:+ start:9326 stop:9691 length:366 start_codon:yes stop_codon:yes gene_type:complete
MPLTSEKLIKKRKPPMEVLEDDPIMKTLSKKDAIARADAKRERKRKVREYAVSLDKEAGKRVDKETDDLTKEDKLAVLENELINVVNQINKAELDGKEEEVKTLKKKVRSLKMQIGKAKKK